jgi:glycosyltransferase involved in cell wall biosynthesis
MSLVPRGVRLIDLNASRLRDVLPPLVRYFKDSRPHALHAAMWPLTVIAVIARRLAGSRSRLVLADHTPLSRHYAAFGSLHRAILSRTIRWFYPLADARVAVSEEASTDLAQLSGLDRAVIEVIYNPVARAPNREPQPEIGALWDDAEGRILSVGRISSEKNHGLLIRAFALLRRQGFEAKLMILGDGPLRSELHAIAASEGVAGQVLLVGFVRDPWPYYASADLFVLSSDYEGFPLALVEAMRSGMTVVSTNCPSGPREILGDGEYGALVPCGDRDELAAAMAAGLRSPADPERMKLRAEQLSGEATSRRHLALMLGENQDERAA